MKLEINSQGQVVALAENINDVKKLIGLTNTKAESKPKERISEANCKFCSFKSRGRNALMGISIHTARIHAVKNTNQLNSSPNNA